MNDVDKAQALAHYSAMAAQAKAQARPADWEHGWLVSVELHHVEDLTHCGVTYRVAVDDDGEGDPRYIYAVEISGRWHDAHSALGASFVGWLTDQLQARDEDAQRELPLELAILSGEVAL